MALNYPGPYQMRFFYTVDGIQHKMQLNTRVSGDPAPGTAMSGINLILTNDTERAATDVITDMADWMGAHLATGDSTIDFAELWKYEAGTFDATYVSAVGISGTTLVSGDSTPAAEFSLLFRTAEGGIMRIVIEEPQIGSFGSFSYAGLPGVDQVFVSEIIGGSVFPWIGRDTSKPIAFKRGFTGQNEKMFRVRYR